MILNEALDTQLIQGNGPEIKIGKNIYYLSSLFDKHLHAGKDVTVFDSFGRTKKIKKGQWLGKLYSWVSDINGKPAMQFEPAGSVLDKYYYLRTDLSGETISEAILKHNYPAYTGWIIPSKNKQGIVTKAEIDKKDAEIDKQYAAIEREEDKNAKLKNAVIVGAAAASTVYFVNKAFSATDVNQKRFNSALGLGSLAVAISIWVTGKKNE